MKHFPDKFKFKLNAYEMETMLNMIERKIQEPLPVYGNGMQPKDILTFNYLLKYHLEKLRIKVRAKYEGSRAVVYKVSMPFPEAIAFYTAFRFGKTPLTDENMLAYKISSEIDPKL